MSKFPRVGKLEAARRHLETAALLHFNDRDPVAIHTLVAAAYGVLSDRARKQGSSMFIHRSLDASPTPEFAKVMKRAMRRAQNFYKHADAADEPESIEYSPQLTQMMLLDAYVKLVELTGERPNVLVAFQAWCWVHFEVLRRMLPPELRAPERERQRVAQLSPQEFLREYLQHAADLRP